MMIKMMIMMMMKMMISLPTFAIYITKHNTQHISIPQVIVRCGPANATRQGEARHTLKPIQLHTVNAARTLL